MTKRPTKQLYPHLGACLLLTGLACAAAAAQEVSAGVYGEPFSQPDTAPAAQTRVYAFRATPSPQSAPVNLYINGRYHASLLHGGYTEFCLNPGRVTLQSALDDAAQHHTGKLQAGQALDIEPARVLYLRVAEAAGQAIQLQPQSETLAWPQIRKTRRQLHTLSRAPDARPCNAPEATPALSAAAPTRPTAAPLPQKAFTLSSDTLFACGKATLLPSAEEAIETLAKQVKSQYDKIERIKVQGFSDPIGPKALNDKLSAQRASAVARLLDQYGLHPMRGYTTQGRGATDLAKIGCSNQATPENKACHAPNRRVVISITGTRIEPRP